MSTLNQNNYQSDWLKYELNPDYNREKITVLAGSGSARALTNGMVLGKVTASGKYVQLAPAAADGSQNVAGVLFVDVTAPDGVDAQGAAVVRGPVLVQDNGLVWPAGITSPQKTTALGQLATLGLIVREGL